MSEDSTSIDPVRASRAGHEFHDAWAVRAALELVPPGTTLTAVAIEGFSIDEISQFSPEAHDIADIVRYHGDTHMGNASRIETVQFKYSIAAAKKPMRASEMTATIAKFAAIERDIYSKPGLEAAKSFYQLVTNRPIDGDTLKALEYLRGDTAAASRRTTAHADKLAAAAALSGDGLRAFMKRLELVGTHTDLVQTRYRNLVTLASWAGAHDSLSQARLDNLRKLVRDRAGARGQGDNLLRRVDILGALDVRHEHELYPVRAAFPPVETRIARPVLDEIETLLFADPRALLIHAAGGFGKTVLMESLAERLAARHSVLLFDGYGAGRWREGADGRHLPRKSLTHLSNLLAAEGLCDLHLQASHAEDSLAAFRERLKAGVAALRQFRADAGIVLILDAVDHCGMQAERTGTQSFASLLLQSLNVAPIEGVAVAASCRTHRRKYAEGDAHCRPYKVPPFTRAETETLARSRLPDIKPGEITALIERSRGNPRVIDQLLRRGRPFDRRGPENDIPTIEALLREQIETARRNAVSHGATSEEVDGVLAGLALLPPPVPVEELAGALEVDPSVVEGFIADLFPLIEPTPTGLIFRDEPTESLVIDMIDDNALARDALVARLTLRQEQSTYAARALPAILIRAKATEDLVRLAFEDFQGGDSSRVGRRAIRLARLKAAASACAAEERTDDLTRLALETARITSANERSDAYLRAHPDLVAISDDTEAMLRFRNDEGLWSGSRHGSLCLFEAFRGDMHAAELEADRCSTWLGWWIREGQSKRNFYASFKEAEAQMVVVRLLGGRRARIDRAIGGLGSNRAAILIETVLTFIDRLARLDAAPDGAAARGLRALARCRSNNPLVLSGIISHITLAPAALVRLITRLAGAPFQTEDKSEEPDYRRPDVLRQIYVDAAGRAAALGLRGEARAILRHARLEAPHIYRFDDPWPLSGGLGTYLKNATIALTGRKRTAQLLDLAPREFLDAVPMSVRSRGPAAFERRIEALIVGHARRRRGGARAWTKDPEGWRRTIDYRLKPLLKLADAAAPILTAGKPDRAIKAAIDAAKAAVSGASDYPYSEQRSFLRHISFELIRWCCQCRTPLSREAGAMLADFLEQSRIDYFAPWLSTATLLARGEATQASALAVAKGAERIIAANTQISDQITQYGELARALAPISPEEARAAFRVGLELADSVGSDDQERIGDFIAFAAKYRGEPIPGAAAHDFLRYCEMNFSEESGNVDWRMFGSALAKLSGSAALAPIARLDDRNKVSLGWGLPPLLKALVETDRLEAGLAAGISGLAEFEVAWNWMPPEIAAAILPSLPQDRKENFAAMTLVDHDRARGAHMAADIYRDYDSLFASELSASSAARARLAALAPRFSGETTTKKAGSSPSTALPAELTDGKTIDAEALGSLVDRIAATYKGTRPTDGFVLRGFVAPTIDPRPRSALLATVAANHRFGLQNTIIFLEEVQEHWRGSSRALDKQIDDLALESALRHLDRIVEPGDSWRRPVARIANLAGARRHEVAPKLIAALAGHGVDISSDFWMSCATLLAETASDAAVAGALSRYVHSTASGLPEAIGDGPWQAVFDAGNNMVEHVADLVWSQLGAPEAATRWRAAHALRRLSELGDDRVLTQLLTRYERSDAGAFQDRRLPFFFLNARLWLLIAAARIAQDRPQSLAPFHAIFEGIATNDEFPHVLLRHFAAETLKAIAPVLAGADQSRCIDLAASVNRSKHVPVPRQGPRDDHHQVRPKKLPGIDFWFEYDFRKFQCDPLAKVFGAPTWKVDEIAAGWIARWDSAIGSMFECPRPRWSSEDRPWGSATNPEIHLHGWQLAWHGVLLAAGELIREKPVVENRPGERRLEKWIEDQLLATSDGSWLADGTDACPADLTASLIRGKGEDNKSLHVPAHPLDLLPLVGADDSLNNPDWLTVAGDFDGPDGLDVTIGSQLVPPTVARAAAHALMCADPFFAYLPTDATDEDYAREDRLRDAGMRRWLASDRERYSKMESQDPYAFKAALHRSRPAPHVIEALGLSAPESYQRRWIDKSGEDIFRAEAWGRTMGRGRHRTEVGGNRLRIARAPLEDYLGNNGSELLLHVKVQRYLDKQHQKSGFHHQMLCLIVRPGEKLETIWSVPDRVRKAVAKLGRYERGELGDRLEAIRALGPLRRQRWPGARPRTAKPDGKTST